MIIKKVSARSILDSRGEKTIEVSVNGSVASSPSGKSTGKYETPCYHKNIDWNIKAINENSWEIDVKKFEDLEKVEELIKKKFKFKDVKEFGANALFAFESAILKALAKSEGKELWEVVNHRAKKFPVPVGNAIGGGLHSSGFKNHPVFQEFLLIPKEKTFCDNVETMKSVYVSLGRRLNCTSVNDEGAWNCSADNEMIIKTISDFSSEVHIGLDIASSSFFTSGVYDYGKTERTPDSHYVHVTGLIKNYEILYVEDPFQEEDFGNFARVKKEISDSLIVGDDLTASQIDRLKMAIEKRAINAMIIKPNQNGSLLELRELFDICKKHKIKTIMSHRSGETMDDALADYAFGFGADYIKCGIATKWRECKLKRMCAIEKGL